jgi:hypothetical protein
MDPEQIPLRDLHLPEAIGWWPPAPGWWLLGLLVLAGLVVLLVRYARRRARGAARRRALRELDALLAEFEAQRDAVRFAAGVSALLRRAMLAYAPRGEVAGLTGEAWLAWLDKGLEHPQFVAGPGRSLLELPYRRPDADLAGVEVYSLVTAVRQRLATPVGGNS